MLSLHTICVCLRAIHESPISVCYNLLLFWDAEVVPYKSKKYGRAQLDAEDVRKLSRRKIYGIGHATYAVYSVRMD